MMKFEEIGLKPELLQAIAELGFENPTPIQEQSIPYLLESDGDLIATAQTGTGKTAAFGLPILHKADLTKNYPQALILSPTRELGLQITEDLKKYSKHMKKLNVTAVYGGASIDTQIRELSRGTHVVVGTPGRTLDLLKRKRLDLSRIDWVILDEADEMLSMGFKEDLNAILSRAPKKRQTLLFSATMPKEILRISKDYMEDPHKIAVATGNTTAKNVTHGYYMVRAHDRYLALKRIVDLEPNIYGIVFCRTRRDAKSVAEKLSSEGYSADALHGDLSQAQRDHVMGMFRKRNLQLLVATDVAARGIDVDEITHVINYQLPDDEDVYVHRSGRTGRANKEGISVCIIHGREKNKLKAIERRIGKRIEEFTVPTGKEICAKQLFKVIDKIEQVKVDEEQIAEYIDAIQERFESMSREDLIKRFVSVEFNRFLEYYKSANDLRTESSNKNTRGEERERRNSRDDRDSGRGRREDRGDREDRRSKRRDDYSFARFFINLGSKNGLVPKVLFTMISERTGQANIEIGDIEILKTFSFFEIDMKYAEKVEQAFSGFRYKGVKVMAEITKSAKHSGAPKEKARKAKKTAKRRKKF